MHAMLLEEADCQGVAQAQSLSGGVFGGGAASGSGFSGLASGQQGFKGFQPPTPPAGGEAQPVHTFFLLAV